MPIACSLTAAGLDDRVTEWQEALASSVEGIDAGHAVVRLRLRGGDGVLVKMVDLAEREQACCPFFGFSVELAHGQRWLTIAVPDDAAEALAGLMSLLPATLRT